MNLSRAEVLVAEDKEDYLSSSFRNIFGFCFNNTRRRSKDLLFGKTIFAKTHNIGRDRYSRHSYYCETDEVLGEIQPLPITDKKSVANFKRFLISIGIRMIQELHG